MIINVATMIGRVICLAEKDNRHHGAEEWSGGADRIGDRHAERIDAFVTRATGSDPG